jgi:hypothetical protein
MPVAMVGLFVYASTLKSEPFFLREHSNEEPVIGSLSVISVVVGTAFAWIASRHARHRDAMQAFGGILLIAGFALLGYALECTFGPPSHHARCDDYE